MNRLGIGVATGLVVAMSGCGSGKVPETGTGGSAAAPVSPAPAKPAPVVPAAFPDAAVVRERLRVLGQRRLEELLREASLGAAMPAGPDGAPEGIALVTAPGDCLRPTAEQRAALAVAVAAADPAAKGAGLRFGCVERNGIVLDVAYDKGQVGTWKIVRASAPSRAARITKLALITGTAMDYWMEWVNEQTLNTLALVDLDGDGLRDPILTWTQHEGGAMHSDLSLSVVLSRTGRRQELGSFDRVDSVSLATAPRAPGSPLVLRIYRDTDERDALRYRCVQPSGVLDLCPELEAARRAERAMKIASDLVAGVGPEGEPLPPDRDRLLELLGELGGSSPAEVAELGAQVPPTSPEVRVERQIARELARLEGSHAPRRFGELVEPTGSLGPTPQRAELLQLLGDAPCPVTTAAQHKAAEQRLRAWVAANSARLLVERGECPKGKPCHWRPHDPLVVHQSCTAGARGAYGVRWTYADRDSNLLAHDALFFLDGTAVKLVQDSSVQGSAAVCGACEGPPEPRQLLQLYRRGAAVMALIVNQYTPDNPQTLALAIDGVVSALPPPPATESAYAFERVAGDDQPAESLLETFSPSSERMRHWHWDGAWRQIAEVPSALSHQPPPADAVSAWLWREHQRTLARRWLESFDGAQWASSSAYRGDVQRTLELAGADAAMRARVATEGSGLAP